MRKPEIIVLWSCSRVVAAVLGCLGLLPAARAGGPAALSPVEVKFLDVIERRAFDFFWNEADPGTGLIRDQVGNFGPETNDFRLHRASIASVGFGLSAYVVGVERGWITREQAEERVRNTLRTFDEELERDGYGLYYHWIDLRTKKRWVWDDGTGSEFSSIDTALFLAGAITAGEYFDERFGLAEFKETAERIYFGVRWSSFAEHLMSFYNEYILVTLLGMGCPPHAVLPDVWRDMRRNYQLSTVNRKEEAAFPRIFYPSLFVHLFPGAWFDFRNKRDAYANYFLNSRNAVLANRQYCMDHGPGGIADPAYRFTTYNSNCWGLSACEAPPPAGYNHYGEAEPALADRPGEGMKGIDGTVAIYVAGGSMPFTPEESLAMLKYLYRTYHDDLWGTYGFCDSFNTDPRVREHFNNPGGTMWRAEVVSGLDQGITLLMIENYRSGLIWACFMRNPHVRRAMTSAGFVPQGDLPANARFDLAGAWRFHSGDDPAWSARDYADDDWGTIEVPGRWEEQGYDGYDGIAWYRKTFDVRGPLPAGTFLFHAGAIDDADEVFVNGRRVGGMGDFPPGAASAWDVRRAYRLPRDLLEAGTDNVVAVRVSDNTAGGGIWKAPVEIVLEDALQYRPLYVPTGP